MGERYYEYYKDFNTPANMLRLTGFEVTEVTLRWSRLNRNIILKQNKSLFKWRHYELASILLCVRWYCQFQLSYRDLEEMMCERGLSVDRTAAKRFFKKMMRAEHRRLPFTVSVDKNAAYPEAFNSSQKEKVLPNRL
jgi:transposase-like protein